MGIPTSEVGYNSATTRREITKSIRDMWWHWVKKNIRQASLEVMPYMKSEICGNLVTNKEKITLTGMNYISYHIIKFHAILLIKYPISEH
jgi:hypothetical protein